MKQILKSELGLFLKQNKLVKVSEEILQEMAVDILNNDLAKSLNNGKSQNKSIEIVDVIFKNEDSLDKSIQHEKMILVTEDFIEKSRGGIYANTSENRKLGRVGQKFGSKKAEETKKPEEDKKSEENNKAEEDKKAKEIFNMKVNDLTKEITNSFDYISYPSVIKKYSNSYSKNVIDAAYKNSEEIWEDESNAKDDEY